MKKMLIGIIFLAVLITASIIFNNSSSISIPAFASNCFRSDIKEQCCDNACQVEKKQGREKANQVLKNCMSTVLGCSKSEIDSADMFSRCDCKK